MSRREKPMFDDHSDWADEMYRREQEDRARQRPQGIIIYGNMRSLEILHEAIKKEAERIYGKEAFTKQADKAKVVPAKKRGRPKKKKP